MARKPRLLMLLHGYYPDEPRVAAEARAALAAGFDVDVVALRRPGEAPSDDIEGVRLRRLPVAHRRGAGLAAMIREYVAFTLLASVDALPLRGGRRYDVVQVHNPPDFLVLAALVPRLFGARIIFDVHDIASYMFGMRFGGRSGAEAAERALQVVERMAAAMSTAVLTVHEPYRRELTKHGIPQEKITIVMNSLDEALLPPPRLEPRTEQAFRIVYHGTVTPAYGVGLIIEAAGLLKGEIPALAVEVYGDGDSVGELESRAHGLGLRDAVRITGYLPQRDVLRAAQRASVGVVPNLPTPHNRFALSTKLLEYVALGVPVVSADLPTIRSYFSDEELLFFRAGDASSLAKALASVAADPQRAAERAGAARRRYEAYRWERNAAAYVEVLRRVAASAS